MPLAPRKPLTGFPTLLREWHPTRNGKLDPSTVTRGNSRAVWWRCTKDPSHEWRTSVAHRVYHHSDCPFCSGRKATPATSLVALHPKLAREWHPTKNHPFSPKAVRPGSGKRVWWQCSADPAHVWRAQICNRALQGTGCPFCHRHVEPGDVFGPRLLRRSLVETHAELCREWHPWKNGRRMPAGFTAASRVSVWWRCSEDPSHVWRSAVWRRAKRGAGCPFCRQPVTARLIPLAKSHPELAREWDQKKNGTLRPTDISARTERRVWWQCREGHSWQIAPLRRIGFPRRGCPVCAKRAPQQ